MNISEELTGLSNAFGAAHFVKGDGGNVSAFPCLQRLKARRYIGDSKMCGANKGEVLCMRS